MTGTNVFLSEGEVFIRIYKIALGAFIFACKDKRALNALMLLRF